MPDHQQHTIARLRWNTVFDQRDSAIELQQRLSHWSRMEFDREVNRVFNRFCKPGQVWRIDTLELDLGIIDYGELEAGLGDRIKKQLTEKLEQLLHNQQLPGPGRLTIIDEKESELQSLHHFLLHGTLLWNHTAGATTVNELFAGQLKQHANALMQLLVETAIRKNVRRRMAWQLNESNITGIIQQLEPAGSAVIIDWTHQLAAVQQQEVLVQCGAAAFKKHIWFWVFNYLFTLQGSVFNKKEYIKSSIRQMAAHFNTDFDELLHLIQQTLHQPRYAAAGRWSSFIQVLQLVAGAEDAVMETAQVALRSGTVAAPVSKGRRRVAMQMPTEAQFPAPAAELQLLRNFLTQGKLPPAGYRDAGHLLDAAWNAGSDATMQLLYQTATRSREVRRRMAWQLPGPGLVRLVQKMEPGNSGVIVDFSNRLLAVQQKETVVQGDAVGFNKNTWFWILNYLFTLHGSAFNRKEFVKSSIRQMAAHYNTAYRPLLALIGKLAAQMYPAESGGGGLVALLRLLAAEQVGAPALRSPQYKGSEETRLDAIRKYFLRPQALQPIGETRRIADWVAHFALRRPAMLATLLQDSGGGQEQWQPVLAQLPTKALDALLAAGYNKTKQSLRPAIQLLEALGRAAGMPVSARLLWQCALQYAYTGNNSTLTPVAITRALLGQMAGATGKPLHDLLPALLTVATPQRLKNMETARAYGYLMAVYKKELAKGQERGLAPVTALLQLLSAMPAGHPGAPALGKILMRQLEERPRLVAAAMALVANRQRLRPLLQRMVTEKLALQLLPFLDAGANAVHLLLQQALKELPGKISQPFFTSHVVVYLLTSPGGDIHRFLKQQLRRLHGRLPAASLPAFGKIINEMLIQDHPTLLAVSPAEKQALSEIYSMPGHESPHRQLERLMVAGSDNQPELCRLLVQHGGEPQLLALQQRRHPAGDRIINYLLPGGSIWLNRLEGIYTHESALKYSGLSTAAALRRMYQIFWQLLPQYALYRGRAAAFEQLLRPALQFSFHRVPVSGGKPVNQGMTIEPTAATEARPLHQQPAALVFSLIQDALTNDGRTVTHAGTAYQPAQLLRVALQHAPVEMRRLLQQLVITQERIALLQTAFPFPMFTNWMLDALHGPAALQLMALLRRFERRPAAGGFTESLVMKYWQAAWQLLQENGLTTGRYRDLLAGLDDDKGRAVTKSEADRAAAAAGPQQALERNLVKKLFRKERSLWLPGLLQHLVQQQQIPAWFHPGAAAGNAAHLLNKAMQFFPEHCRQYFRKSPPPRQQLQSMAESMPFGLLLQAMGRQQTERRAQLKDLAALHAAMDGKTWGGTPRGHLQQLLFIHVFNNWLSGNWRMLQPAALWQELIWQLVTRHYISKTRLLKDMEMHRSDWPAAFGSAFTALAAKPTTPVTTRVPVTLKPAGHAPAGVPYIDPSAQLAKEGILVFNAGLVLLSGYIPMYFERLGLTAGNQFISHTAQLEAVHYLQYLATGSACTEEGWLCLNKIVCGLAADEPVPGEITIMEQAPPLVEGLINAVVGYWPAIGDTTLHGFRGNWLVRKGLFTELDDKWDLNIEKRAYDLLLGRAPFSFSVVKFPWMKKPVHVTWPY